MSYPFFDCWSKYVESSLKWFTIDFILIDQIKTENIMDIYTHLFIYNFILMSFWSFKVENFKSLKNIV